MDKLKKYRRILKTITEEHAQISSPIKWVQSTAVCDFEQNNFFLIDYDLKDKKHYIVFHLRLDDGKIFIEQDGVEDGIAQDLVQAGILPKDIVDTIQTKERENILLAA